MRKYGRQVTVQAAPALQSSLPAPGRSALPSAHAASAPARNWQISDDGSACINVYSAGVTALGRFLSNFTACTLELPEGRFASVEGYWYYLSLTHCAEAQSLRTLSGLAAKRRGQALRRAHGESTVEDFQGKILRAIEHKLAQRPDMQRALREKTLPLAHYYVMQGQPRAAGHHWLIEGMEAIAMRLRGQA